MGFQKMQGNYWRSREYFDLVIGKLKKMLDIKTDRDLCDALEMNQGTYVSRKGTSSLPYREINALCIEKGLDMNALYSNLVMEVTHSIGEASIQYGAATQPIAGIDKELFGFVLDQLEGAFGVMNIHPPMQKLGEEVALIYSDVVARTKDPAERRELVSEKTLDVARHVKMAMEFQKKAE